MHTLLGLEIGYITNKDLFGSAKTLSRQHIGILTQAMLAVGGSGIVLDWSYQQFLRAQVVKKTISTEFYPPPLKLWFNQVIRPPIRGMLRRTCSTKGVSVSSC